MRITNHMQRYPLLYLGTLVLRSVLFLVASLPEEEAGAPADRAPQPEGKQDSTEAEWADHQWGDRRISYPRAWELEAVSGREGTESYRFHIPTRRVDTHLTVERRAFSGTPSALEDWMVDEITSNVDYARLYLRRLPSARLAGEQVARLHYVIELASGQQMRGIRLALSNEVGGTFVFDLQTAGAEALLQTREALCMRVLASLAGPGQRPT